MKVEVSNGELLDKLTILLIKSERLESETGRREATKEYNHLFNASKELNLSLADDADYIELKEINEQLWGIEDKIREKEANKTFDGEFIRLSRNIYFLNDKRFIMKNRINAKTNSEFKEQKSHKTCNTKD